MTGHLMLYKNLTMAQRAASLLKLKKINASVVKAPRDVSDASCAYAVSVTAAQLDAALEALRVKSLNPERILYGYSTDGRKRR